MPACRLVEAGHSGGREPWTHSTWLQAGGIQHGLLCGQTAAFGEQHRQKICLMAVIEHLHLKLHNDRAALVKLALCISKQAECRCRLISAAEVVLRTWASILHYTQYTEP